MYLKRFAVQDIKCFGEVALDFCRADGQVKRWNVILGQNGTGKSTLLQAIAMTLIGPDPATCDVRFPELTEAIRAVPREVRDAIYMEEHQVKIPGTQMAMVALEYGIQCTWVSHFEVKRVAQILRLPDRYLPSNLLAFGYPKGKNPTEGGWRRKRDLQDIVFYDTGENLPPADQVPHWKP